MSINKANVLELPPPLRISPPTTGDGMRLRLAVPPTVEQLRARAQDKVKQSTVPSLLALCVLRLSAHLHRISDLERCWARRSYHSPSMKLLVSELFPHLSSDEPHVATNETSIPSNEVDVENEFRGTIDPYLWGLINALILPSTLPSGIRRLGLNIIDPTIPGLQYSPVLNTTTLSLLTCLSFDSQEIRLRITDDSLLQLRSLPCLTLLDLASTPITSRGIQRLIVSMKARRDTSFGPWRLRVLDLHGTFVDDNLFDESETNLSIFPLLFAIDVRMTSVRDTRQDAFESWFDDATALPELFSPTTLRDRINHVSKLIHESESSSSLSDHAMLFIDHHPTDFVQGSQSEITAEERLKAAQKLRASTAGVCVLTKDTTLLGNIIEPTSSTEEGVLFRPSRLGASLSDPWTTSNRKFDQTSSRQVNPVSESDQEHVLWRLPPPMRVFEAFTREIAAPSMPAREGLKSSEPRVKRPRAGEQTYSVKRFKGSSIESIFGRNPPSRRL